MKIRDIKTKIYNASIYSNWIFVFIETDIGLTGIGEATLDGREKNVVKLIDELKKYWIGIDIISNFKLPEIDMTDITFAAAYSGIDMAIWDLKGKFYRKPIRFLLSDRCKTQIETYATFNRALVSRNLEDYERIAYEIVCKGYKGIKCAPFDGVMPGKASSNEKFIDRGIERISHIRKVIGDKIKLKVDCHWRFDYEGAIHLLDKLQFYNLYWLEAPIAENNPEKMKLLRKSMNIMLAGAEMQSLKHDYLILLQNEALDIYMPDIKFVGGVSGFWEISKIIEKHNRFISPHNMSGPVASAASIQVASALNKFLVLEMHINESSWSDDVSDLNSNLTEGNIQLSEKVGLGIELDMKEIEKHPYREAVFLRDNILGPN